MRDEGKQRRCDAVTLQNLGSEEKTPSVPRGGGEDGGSGVSQADLGILLSCTGHKVKEIKYDNNFNPKKP